MIYINGTASISPQPTFEEKEFLENVVEYSTNWLRCIEPDYKEFLSPTELRRISRVLKLGWSAAKSCLDDAALSLPDAIITGTGLGCYRETQKFIYSMYENKEMLLSPTPFIQSSHGSIAAQIAMKTGCRDYNMTYAHRGFSFESALLDALMLLNEGHFQSVLTGGVDEMGKKQYVSFDRIGYWKKQYVSNLDLLKNDSDGTIAGEGSTFFLLQNFKGTNTYARIKSVHVFSNLSGNVDVEARIKNFLQQQEMDVNEIDLVLLGLNGDRQFDPMYQHLMAGLFKNSGQAFFKHLCGEYHTSTSFALWLAAKMLKEQKVRSILKLNDIERNTLKNILIYNHYRNINHSLILVSTD